MLQHLVDIYLFYYSIYIFIIYHLYLLNYRRYLVRNPGSKFEDCTGLPKRFYEALNEKFVPLTSKVCDLL